LTIPSKKIISSPSNYAPERVKQMPVRRVSPKEASELQGQGYTYVDVRSEAEFSQGHPKGSVNIPIAHKGPMGMSPNNDFLKVFEANFPKGSKLIIGCLSGGRSARAAEALSTAGYTDLVDQRAGFGGNQSEAGWASAGLPVETTGLSYQELSKKAGL
jgi:rhodanese-related sulfurtransferase